MTESDYTNALSTLIVTPLSERRTDLFFNFAKKAFTSEKYQIGLYIEILILPVRSDKTGLTPVDARTNRFKNSPLPNLTSLLDNSMKQK